VTRIYFQGHRPFSFDTRMLEFLCVGINFCCVVAQWER